MLSTTKFACENLTVKLSSVGDEAEKENEATGEKTI